jgi:hypothetical protein
LSDPAKRAWFEEQAQEAAEHCAVQYYHYARPDTPSERSSSSPQAHAEDARAEAHDFLAGLSLVPEPDLVEFQPGRQCSVWVDLEETLDNLDEFQGLEWILEWFAVIEARYLCGIYTSERWLRKESTPMDRWPLSLYRRDDGSNRPLWAMRYGQNDGTYPAQSRYPVDENVPDLWGRCDVHQYTSVGVVTGIPSPCDRNRVARMVVL